MLVLSRRIDQTVIMGENLYSVTVVDVRHDRARLGFDCPPDVAVYRKELFDAIVSDIRGGGTVPAQRPRAASSHGMLALSRHVDESIIIIPYAELVRFADAARRGQPYTMTTVEVMLVEIRSGDTCRIGITAPKSLAVHRKEVADDIKRGVPQNKSDHPVHRQ